MDDLVAFLGARLDEDEQAAAAASEGPWTPWRDRPGLGLRGLEYAVTLPGQSAGSLASIATASWLDAEHIARHDPARVLREVAFKRAILAMHAPVPFWGNNPPPLRDRTPENAVSSYCECQCPDGVIEDTYPCDTARLLAAVYSGHPDYRTEWKPS